MSKRPKFQTFVFEDDDAEPGEEFLRLRDVEAYLDAQEGAEQITTAEALDALPVGSVVRLNAMSWGGLCVAERHPEGWQGIGNEQHFSSADLFEDKDDAFTVLYPPAPLTSGHPFVGSGMTNGEMLAELDAAPPAAPVSDEPTAEEYREAYETWRAHGQAMHAVLLDLWRAVTPDSEHSTFGDDPDVVRSAVLAALAPAPVADDEREVLARVIFLGRYPGSESAWDSATATEKALWYERADAILAAGYHRTPSSPATVEGAARVLADAGLRDSLRAEAISRDQRPPSEYDILGICEEYAQALAGAGYLRGVVTEAMVERACAAAWSAEHPSVSWDEIRHASPTAGDQVRAVIRAALSAAFEGEVSER